ncbi:MAG TPA: helix-turn-helix domain-containing protein [Candidatus Saccharimonadales bacterium]|nr:helix-turn-helix domain-containing protein [Candidatus Saccharimonadales bacterium]
MTRNIDSVYKELGKRIADARKRSGMSQERLAAESAIDRSHLGFIEQGRRKPTVATLYKITKVLGLTLEQMFKGL